jgi:hypothetical protein
MLTRTVESAVGTNVLMQYTYCCLKYAAYCIKSTATCLWTVLAVCCCGLTIHKYRHRSVTLSLLSCGTAHLVFLAFCSVSVSVSTHRVSSYILLRLRLLCFDSKHDLAVRDLQVSCWSEAGISTGYKHDERLKENLGINRLQTAE